MSRNCGATSVKPGLPFCTISMCTIDTRSDTGRAPGLDYHGTPYASARPIETLYSTFMNRDAGLPSVCGKLFLRACLKREQVRGYAAHVLSAMDRNRVPGGCSLTVNTATTLHTPPEGAGGRHGHVNTAAAMLPHSILLFRQALTLQ